MKHTLQLFAVARELAGGATVELELPAGATIADLRRALVAHTPGLAKLDRHLMFAMNADYVSDATVIVPGAELACIPPVSGG